MSKTSWAVLGFNALAVLMAVVGLVSADQDPMDIGLLLSVVALVVNSVFLIRGAERRPEVTPQPVRDGLDAHQLLYIDERLEALERAEARALKVLADEGVVRAPASETAEAEPVRAGQPLPNGRS